MAKKQKADKEKTSVSHVLSKVLCALLAISIAFCLCIITLIPHYSTSQGTEPDIIMGISVHTDYINEDSIARPARYREIHYIVIHETDNNGSRANAKAHNQYLHENCWKEQKSWHYTVDDTEIWHHLPDNEVGFHAGDSSHREGGNRNGIGIELCVNRGGDFEKTMQNAAQLTAYLLRTYDLEMDAVKKHQDFSGKNCPSTIISQGRWEEFLKLVQDAYTEQERQAAIEETNAADE